MFWLWRFHSVESAWKRKDKRELAFMVGRGHHTHTKP